MTQLPDSSETSLSRRRFIKTSAATISGLALSSCGWTLAQVKPEPVVQTDANRLYIYTWSQYTDENLLQEFAINTGVKVIVDVFDSNEAMLNKVLAGGGNAYSVIYPSDYAVEQMLEKNLSSPLEKERLNGVDNLLPQFRDSKYDPNNGHSIPVSWGTTGLIYNSKKLNPPPQDWAYLWQNQQKLTRKITLVNDVREVMGATLRMLGYSYNSTNEQQVRQAYEKLKALKPAIASFTTDAWKEQLLAGDILLAMCYSADAADAISENPDLRYVIPNSGTSLWTDTMVIPRFAPNVDAAYAWINFMLQPAVAASLTERLNFGTPNQTAIKQLPAKIQNNPSIFAPDSILAKCERISPVGKFSEVYDRYWTQLTSG
jgi:spermidine/putrescine transport system substrate-binding protein